MAPLNVHIKHAGRVHDVQLDIDQPPTAFKDAIYQVTGVSPERMKVMVKGGMLKVCMNDFYRRFCSVTFALQDDHDWKKVAPKEVRDVFKFPAPDFAHTQAFSMNIGSNIHGHWRCRRTTKASPNPHGFP